jgi:preprotein translocase subunit SecD
MRFRILTTISLSLFSAVIVACIPSLRASSYAWQLVLETGETEKEKATAVPQAIAIIQRRLEVAGVRDFSVGPTGSSQNPQILVKLPAGVNLVRLKSLITTHGQLEFVSVISPQSPAPVQTYNSQEEAIASTGQQLPPDRRVLPYKENDQTRSSGLL